MSCSYIWGNTVASILCICCVSVWVSEIVWASPFTVADDATRGAIQDLRGVPHDLSHNLCMQWVICLCMCVSVFVLSSVCVYRQTFRHPGALIKQIRGLGIVLLYIYVCVRASECGCRCVYLCVSAFVCVLEPVCRCLSVCVSACVFVSVCVRVIVTSVKRL